MHGVGHIVLAGVVHKVKHHQALLAGGQPHASAQLLGIGHLRHGGAGHEQNFRGWTVPALVEQVAGAQHLGHALFKPGQHLPAVTAFDLSGHGLGGHTSVMEPPSDLLGVLDGGAEDDRPLVLHILEPGVHDELVSLRHVDLALQIPDVVLDAVEPHLGQVNVGVDADTPHRHQRTDLHSSLDVHLVGGILEDVQDVFVVSSFRCGGQAQGKFRRKVRQNLLVCIGGGMVGLVHDDVAEVIRLEPFQIQRHTLDTAADHKGVALLHALHIAAHRGPGPQLPEGLGGLIHQFHRVGQEQRALAKPLGIHDGGHRFSSAGSVIEEGDGLEVTAHFVQGLAPLGGEVVLNLLEAGVLAQENPQFILHSFRLLLHLPHRPAVHIPAQVDHAVLLEQVVAELVLGDQLWIVGCLIIDFDGHLPPAVFNQKISKPAVLIDVGEGVL